jgi:hypothetical protein
MRPPYSRSLLRLKSSLLRLKSSLLRLKSSLLRLKSVRPAAHLTTHQLFFIIAPSHNPCTRVRNQ